VSRRGGYFHWTTEDDVRRDFQHEQWRRRIDAQRGVTPLSQTPFSRTVIGIAVLVFAVLVLYYAIAGVHADPSPSTYDAQCRSATGTSATSLKFAGFAEYWVTCSDGRIIDVDAGTAAVSQPWGKDRVTGLDCNPNNDPDCEPSS